MIFDMPAVPLESILLSLLSPLVLLQPLLNRSSLSFNLCFSLLMKLLKLSETHHLGLSQIEFVHFLKTPLPVALLSRELKNELSRVFGLFFPLFLCLVVQAVEILAHLDLLGCENMHPVLVLC